MDILAKMNEYQKQFESLQAAVSEREQNKQNIDAEIAQITDEMKRIQGGYRTLVELGKEAGLLDENGQPLNLTEAQPEKETAEKAE